MYSEVQILKKIVFDILRVPHISSFDVTVMLIFGHRFL